MAKDDYDVIVFKVLLYYYAVLKRKILFEKITFDKVIGINDISEEYFIEVLLMMQEDGYIKNLAVKKAWGGDYILLSDFDEIKITSKGIEYLKENSKMQKVKEKILEFVDLASKLVQIVLIAN